MGSFFPRLHYRTFLLCFQANKRRLSTANIITIARIFVTSVFDDVAAATDHALHAIAELSFFFSYLFITILFTDLTKQKCV